MGQGSSRERKDAKAITKKSVQATKIERAKATGILSLHACKLKNIPTDVFEITKLNTLDLSNNSITEVPAITQLVNLKTLKLDNNQLTSLPDLSPLTKLQNLVLDNNRIVTLNGLPASLTKLSARGNAMEEFPLCICYVPNLEVVDLGANAIANVPDTIAQCTGLKELTLDNNQLTMLPAALAECPKLAALFVRNNRLGKTSISSAILAYSAIHIMQLEGNPMTKYDLEEMEGIEAFLERRKKLKDKEIHGGLSTDVSLCGLEH
ncbi:hypothetical protein THRCLA_05587 [Thraustotheca clavata]|uniref:Uncharacterized protein n=1 Tax=Thraustotheca clavata TaxID=74557 RepID=A0A1V9ZVH6_9STRA|nr:hypothetical protein THRCLA_05587 [Thraustotheca clavata]